jgi:3-phosphoshikimate 1-carboxyvinyltransferase
MTTFSTRRCGPIVTDITIPGDKSISHRSAMFASLAEGRSTITGFLESEDCLSTVNAMRSLGARIEHTGKGTFVIDGCGGKFTAPTGDVDCGNSGTTMRLISGILAAQPFRSRLIGDASLSKRPMGRVINPLTEMGGHFTSEGDQPGRPPLVIDGGSLQPISYEMPVASAQVKSAILLAGLSATGETSVIEPAACRDHTERMLQEFGVALDLGVADANGRRHIAVKGPQTLKARDFAVPGDISSAAFWLVAAAAKKGSDTTIESVGLNPTRTGIISVLQRMGAKIEITPVDEKAAEPLGKVRVLGGPLQGTVIEGAEIPNVIDELPILAVAGALAQGKTIIKDAKELRVKETDRIAAVAGNLRLMGAIVTETEDGMIIEGGHPLHGATLQCFGDHRIAMAFAIAGLFADGETVIENVECVATSYPTFGATLASILTPQPGHVIAIDGPAASGKSSVSKGLAAALGYTFISSGHFYRALAWGILRDGLAQPLSTDTVNAWVKDRHLQLQDSRLLLDGDDATPYLSSADVAAMVSPIAAFPSVRDLVNSNLRALAETTNLVMEGRDIGSVVFPETPYKFYLDASPEERARRRAKEGAVDSVAERDRLDSTRATAPLKIPEGATVIDTTQLNLEQVIQAVLSHLKPRLLAD